jgi:hypothetical protein
VFALFGFGGGLLVGEGDVFDDAFLAVNLLVRGEEEEEEEEEALPCSPG